MPEANRRTQKLWGNMLAGLNIPEPLTIEGMRRAVEIRTQRPLVIVRGNFRDGGDSPCGMWYQGRLKDYVLVDRGVAGAQYDQTVGHELGHILLGHQARTSANLMETGQIFDVLNLLPKALVSDALAGSGLAMGRTVFDNEVEAEAERFGMFLAREIDRAHLRSIESRRDPVLQNVRDSLGLRDF